MSTNDSAPDTQEFSTDADCDTFEQAANLDVSGDSVDQTTPLEDTIAAGQQDSDLEGVEQISEQLNAANDKYIRLMAEFDNYKRRTSRDYERMVEMANESLMKDIIEIRDNFERALTAGSEKTEFTAFYEGIKLIFTKFDEKLQKNGLEPFAQSGEPFDPQIHDALMKSPHETIDEDHVCQVFEKGYRLRGRVIKHARVVVSSGMPQGESTETASNNNE